MKRKLFLILLIISSGLFFILGCGGDNDDGPTGGGDANAGTLSEHKDGPNEAVTIDNVETVAVEINTMAWSAFGRAMTTVYDKPASDITTYLDSDIEGYENGTATVEGKIVTKISGINLTGYEYNFTCTFNDFSDDGELFLGGSVLYRGSTNYGSDFQFDDSTITMKGGIRFNGKYEGIEEFTTNVKVTRESISYNVTTTVTSGGETFTYSFSY